MELQSVILAPSTPAIASRSGEAGGLIPSHGEGKSAFLRYYHIFEFRIPHSTFRIPLQLLAHHDRQVHHPMGIARLIVIP